MFIFAHIWSMDGRKDLKQFYIRIDNYLHGFRNFSEMCLNSKLFCMSMHM